MREFARESRIGALDLHHLPRVDDPEHRHEQVVDMGILLHRHAREDLHDGILDIVARFAHGSHRFITR